MTTSTFKIISGKLPPNLQLLSDGTISGILDPVLNTTQSKFVIRETSDQGITDQTYSIDVPKTNFIVWNTPAGYLPVGVNDEQYAFNNQWVQFQLDAESNVPIGNTPIKFYIPDHGGKLPPGLILDQTGIISGFIKDQLSIDSYASLNGGYDTDFFDKYNYDHGTSFVSTSTTNQIIGVPKIYRFNVVATDGVISTSTTFKIVVTDTDILNYNLSAMPQDVPLLPIPPGDIYVQYPQWINGSDLGIIRAENNDDISVQVYDPTPSIGSLSYTLTTGTNALSNLPDGLLLDSRQGYIYGFIPYQPAYTKTYRLTINAIKTINHSNTYTSVTSTNVFSLIVKGAVDSTINWVSTASLGTIEPDHISELAVNAAQIGSSYSIKYSLYSGILPPGLSLERDGSIVGEALYGNTGTYTFTVQANDVYELNAIFTTTSITVVEQTSTQYTNIYLKPYLTKDKRTYYNEFISNEAIFTPSLMYRYFDPNFGVQREIKIMLEYNIERVQSDYFAVAMQENFYRKKLWFGDVKTAIAKNDQGNIVYEIVYIDIIDDMINNDSMSISSTIYQNNENYHPNSIDNMRERLRRIQLPNNVYIEVDDLNLPRFMKTAQGNSYIPPGYIKLVPLCYTLPNQSSKIVSQIKFSGFDFKKVNFEIDRLIIHKSQDNGLPKFLVFSRESLNR